MIKVLKNQLQQLKYVDGLSRMVYPNEKWNGGTKPPQCGARFAFAANRVTRVTVCFSDCFYFSFSVMYHTGRYWIYVLVMVSCYFILVRV